MVELNHRQRMEAAAQPSAEELARRAEAQEVSKRLNQIYDHFSPVEKAAYDQMEQEWGQDYAGIILEFLDLVEAKNGVV